MYQKHTHPTDAVNRRDLYLVNKQDIFTMKVNLGILLGDEEKNNGELFFPTEEEVICMLREIEENNHENEKIGDNIELNEAYAVIWEENSSMNWFVGFAISKDSEGTMFEYLERSKKSEILLWNYPRNKWNQIAYDIQILRIKVECEWDYGNANKPILHVTNCKDIQSFFDDYIENE